MSRSNKWGCLIRYLIHSLVFITLLKYTSESTSPASEPMLKLKECVFFSSEEDSQLRSLQPPSAQSDATLKSRKRDEETSRPVTCCRKQQRYTHQNKEAGSEPDGWEHSHPDTAALKRNSTLPDSLHHVPPRQPGPSPTRLLLIYGKNFILLWIHSYILESECGVL